jgi:methylmalonyl-CoA mutase N-terminal domain/subunit
MVQEKEKGKEIILDRGKDRLIRLQTECGLDVKPVYGPQDLEDLDYEEDLGLPGHYPFTRGIYENMYRDMLWLGAQALQRETIEKSRQQLMPIWMGGSPVVYWASGDVSRTGLDPDHPLAKHDISYSNENYSLERIERLLAGISLESGVFQFHGASSHQDDVLLVAQLAGAAEKRGVDKAKIRGSVINDPITNKATNFSIDWPFEISMRLHGDLAEFIVKDMPKFTPFTPIAYDLYEAGCNSVQQIAIILASLTTYVEAGLERGLTFEQLGKRIAISMASCMDFFETICKIRATRRMWARIARERFGAEDPNLCRLRIAIRTPGLSLTRQQPLNNIARIALQAVAAVLGGANAVDYARHDEARCVPSEESLVVTLALNHIVAQETGIALTADPVGGSYYVESLTNKLEEEADKLIQEIDAMGGMRVAIESGWLRQLVDNAHHQRLADIDEGKLIQVGVNYFRIPEEQEPECTEYEFEDMDRVQAELLAEIKKFKETRDIEKTREALLILREKAKTKENLMYPLIEAFKADATRAEILGMIREAYGYAYDTVGMIQRPSFLD